MKTHKHAVRRRRPVGCLHSGGRRYRGQEQGLALVLTLFVVALVTVLVLEYHFDAAVELDLAMNYANDVQAYHLALAGVRFAQALLQRDDPKVDGPVLSEPTLQRASKSARCALGAAWHAEGRSSIDGHDGPSDAPSPAPPHSSANLLCQVP